MPTTEHTINDALASELCSTRKAWRAREVVLSENTGTLLGSKKQPDILVIEPNVSPVVIETEVLPAVTVESDAKGRLGIQIRSTGKKILSSIALRLPARLREKQAPFLQSEIKQTDDLEMAVYTGNDQGTCSRWPTSGWLKGTVADLSILVQSASVPPSIIDEAAEQLVTGVTLAASLLDEIGKNHPAAIHKMSVELCQEDGVQTRRMAATILANAFIFQETLSGGSGELANVKTIEELRDSTGNLTKTAVLAEWRKILKVNYWPIFDIARRLLEVIPAHDSKLLVDQLVVTADGLLQTRLMRSHDLTGAVFQRMIIDRKFLAAYYTTSAAAALLAGLAIESDLPSGGTWGNGGDVKALRIADFACGTGTLLSTVYQRVSQLHELAGGDSESLHPEMMARALVGCDVLPAAAHLTASMLAGAHPTVKYSQSSILTVAYGKQEQGNIALGSLDLLDPQGHFEILSITAKAAEGLGESERITWKSLPHASFDLVIMNPPFTRATGHEGRKIGVPNPMFAAFKSDKEEQRLMSKAMAALTKETSYHGNAGEASAFLVLAHRKLKASGTLALVMPISLMLGESWSKSRQLLGKNYSDLILITIAGAEDADLSFSADTDMGECLVIGKRTPSRTKRATFVVLVERPKYPLVGAYAAEQIRKMIRGGRLSRLEDGPVGGTPLRFGDDLIGRAINAPLGDEWNLSRIADLSLAQVAFQLTKNNRVWLPTMNESMATSIPVTTIGSVAKIGPYHSDVSGVTQDGSVRGPFEIVSLAQGSIPTYPVLWAHEARSQQTMSFDADSEGKPRAGSSPKERAEISQKVQSVWETASHCHFNRDFRFNSQSVGMQFTPRNTIGGRAWLSIKAQSVKQEKALVLWGNTTLGLLLHWWHANKQQSGRGTIGKNALQTMPVLNIARLSKRQINQAVHIFDSLNGKSLLPLQFLGQDQVRKNLDNDFAKEVLGLPQAALVDGGPLELLRMKLGSEPSIRGKRLRS